MVIVVACFYTTGLLLQLLLHSRVIIATLFYMLGLSVGGWEGGIVWSSISWRERSLFSY